MEPPVRQDGSPGGASASTADTLTVPIKVVAKLARILDVFRSEGAELPLGRIAAAAEIEVSTTSRLVTSLTRVGLLRYDPVQRLYSPGLMILELSRVVLTRFSFRELAHRELIALSAETGWECYMAVPDEIDDHHLIYIDAVATRAPEASVVGQRRAMHSTATGKVLLAFRNVMPNPGELQANTIFTHVDIERLGKELAVVKRKGYAVSLQEEQLDYYSAAAPVFDSDGHILAALGVGVTHKGEAFDPLPLVDAVVKRARGISSAVGLGDSLSSLR